MGWGWPYSASSVRASRLERASTSASYPSRSDRRSGGWAAWRPAAAAVRPPRRVGGAHAGRIRGLAVPLPHPAVLPARPTCSSSWCCCARTGSQLGSRWRPFEGSLLVVYVIMFSLKRFTVEFFRADYAPMLGPFSLVHLVTMLMFGWAVWLWLRMLPGRAPEGGKTF